MAANTDHVRRDAEHAARNFVSTRLGRVSRRWNEADKTKIKLVTEQSPPVGVDEYEWGIVLGEKIAAENAKLFFSEALVDAEKAARAAATKLLELESGAESPKA